MSETTRGQYQRGTKLEPGQSLVARPSKWGNPFRVISERGKHQWLFRVLIPGEPCFGDFVHKSDAHGKSVKLYRQWFEEKVASDPAFKRELRVLLGQELMCYCAPDMPCHADVLIEYLNKEGDSNG